MTGDPRGRSALSLRRRLRRLVLIGPESTGKTTLARELADRFGLRWVPEYARTFVEQVRRPVRREDVEAIAVGQMATEDEAMAGAGAPVILDTDLVSTLVYSRHYFGGCPSWVEASARARLADLYLLMAVDVPWVAEDDQREQPERWEELYALFRSTLAGLGARVAEVGGTWDERRVRAKTAAGELFRSGGEEDRVS